MLLTNPRLIAPLMLSILAIALSAWSILATSKSTVTQSVYNSFDADSYMKDVNATIFNEEGNVILRLSSPKMIHFPEQDKSTIESPHLTIYRHSAEPWIIDAKFANTKNGLKEILFLNDVEIHHLSDKENPDTQLSTQSLMVFPDEQIASTKEAITFKQPDTTISAVGMKANLETGAIQLLSQAKGEYVPTN